MMQPIVVKDDSLARGIEQAGSAFGSAMMEMAKDRRQQEKYRKSSSALNDVLQSLPENATAIDIQKALATASQNKDVDPNYLNETFKTLMPLYQERIKSNEGMRVLQSIFPNSQMFGEGQSGEQQGIQQQENAPLLQNEMGQQEGVQQASQKEWNPSVQHTIESPGLGNVSRSQIDALIVSPYSNLQKLGQSLDERWNNQYKANSKENSEIRKEYREQINKYSEPYQDTSKLKTNLNKLKEADKLIDSGKVSVDGNWFRSAVTSILEGHESSFAEMIKTPEQQKLFYLLKDSLKTKDIGGSNPSTKEVIMSLSAMPGQYKGQSANKFIIKNMINQAEADLYKADVISKLRQKTGSISYPKFQTEVDKSVGKFIENKQKEFEKDMVLYEAKDSIKNKPLNAGNVWMVDPEGRARQIPKSEVKQAELAGGTILK